jgi:hypothetical protein
MSRPNPPTAAIGSPAPARDAAATGYGHAMNRNDRLGRLTRTLLADGSAAYALHTDRVRSTVARLLGPPAPAFVERGAATTSPYLELVGTKDHEIAAAMPFAAQRWGNDDVIIHVGGRHTAKIIEHAVANGLNVANRDAYIQWLVARERKRQVDPLRRRAGAAADPIAVVERAPAAPHRSR